MSTDLVATPQVGALAMSVGEKQQYASLLSEANMLPKQYQKNPANVFLAIELGNALSIAPIVAINEINVINGTPAPSASLMASLARSAGHRVRAWNDETGAAVCEIVRQDDPDFTHRSVWDQAKAQSAGLWGKGHWSKDPATMLRWRAISECVRLACPEVLGGLKYTPEEVMEIRGGDAPAQQPQRAAAPRQATSPAASAPPEGFLAAISECQTQDEVTAVASRIAAAGQMHEYRDALNAQWEDLAEPVQGEAINETTGEIINEQENEHG